MGQLVLHSINPIYNEKSKILILGTMPSPKSRETGFYYAHPQNKFWRVVSDVLGKQTPVTNVDKTNFLYDNNIALWDVLKACDIEGADDASIKNPIPNDIKIILQKAHINAIFTTGKKATALYKKLCYYHTNREAVYLPSTSPANCRFYTYDELIKAYEIVLKYIK